MTEPVNTTLGGARTALRRLVVACALAACALGCGAVLTPAPACALEVQKLTAQPNADAGSDVLGGKETRLTWEFQADDDEALTGFTVTLPQGTEFSTEDARVTILSGEDLMDRTFVKPKYSVDGQTVKATFPDYAIVRIISRLKNDAISSIPPAGTAIACREGCGRRSRRRARSGNSTE